MFARSIGIAKRSALALAGAAVLGLLAVAPGLAADSVSQTVNGGTRSASVANLTLTAKSYSHSNQSSTGTMVLTADDSTGTGAGWNVTIQTSAFVYSGSNGGTNIAAANFSLTSAATPVMTAGEAVDGTNGPKVPSTSPVGALDSAREVIEAEVGFGEGTYTQDLGVSLTIPGGSRAGTYTGTLTTTINAGP